MLEDFKLSLSFAGWNVLPNKEIPIILHESHYPSIRQNSSYFNDQEIHIVEKYVDILLENKINGGSVEEVDIGIVSPQYLQILKLEEKLKYRRGIEIGNCSHFKDRDQKILIVSTVISGPDFSFGTLDNENVRQTFPI